MAGQGSENAHPGHHKDRRHSAALLGRQGLLGLRENPGRIMPGDEVGEIRKHSVYALSHTTCTTD